MDTTQLDPTELTQAVLGVLADYEGFRDWWDAQDMGSQAFIEKRIAHLIELEVQYARKEAPDGN